MGGSGSRESLRNLSKGMWLVREYGLWTQVSVTPKSKQFNMLLSNFATQLWSTGLQQQWQHLSPGPDFLLHFIKVPR